MRTRVGEGAIVEDSVIMGSDTYPVRQTTWDGKWTYFFGETHVLSNSRHINFMFFWQRSGGDGEGDDARYIPIGIGKGSYIRKAIVDKNARIGKNVKVERMKIQHFRQDMIDLVWFVLCFVFLMQIINKDNVVEGNKEADGYVITGGIIVVIRSAVISDGSILWDCYY